MAPLNVAIKQEKSGTKFSKLKVGDVFEFQNAVFVKINATSECYSKSLCLGNPEHIVKFKSEDLVTRVKRIVVFI